VSTLEKLTDIFRVVAFVETDVLVPTSGRLRAFDGNAIEGCLKKFDVVRVGAAYLNAQRHAVAIGEYGSLGAPATAGLRQFPRSVGFLPVFFPTQRRLGHRSVHALPIPLDALEFVVFKECSLPQLAKLPTPGSNDAGYFPNRTLRVTPSIGSQCVIRKKCRWQFFENHNEVDPLEDSFDSEATTVPYAATSHRGDTKNDPASVFLPCETPPCWHEMSEKLLSIRRRNTIVRFWDRFLAACRLYTSLAYGVLAEGLFYRSLGQT